MTKLFRECEQCEFGEIMSTPGGDTITEPCPDCDGKGRIPYKVPADIEALVDEYFQKYHVNAVATSPHSSLDDPIEAADDQKERDYLAVMIAAFCEAEVENYKLITNLSIELGQTKHVNDDLRAENEQLREALGFYADQENWTEKGETFKTSAIDTDVGDIAQAALKGAEKG